MQPTTIGPYQVLRELGRGGMGEVYLARDPRLDRQVAIKALPAHLAQDPDRLARFQREAKVLASLNHSNVGAIYGIEEAGGHQYLILEFVEGETLAARLLRGPIPIDEALAIGKQIAEALEAAHDKGVIHRDLKPANVMTTGDGVAKVLDFGLARTADPAPSSTGHAGPAANSPTLTSPMPMHSPTIPGVIMGTAGYMSPEQARGKALDKRTDIWSFGCVLYECLTGMLAFGGETTSDSIAAILEREPDWSKLPPRTPLRVRELLKHCLEKDSRRRLRDAGDARLALEHAISAREWNSTQAFVAVSGETRTWRRSARTAVLAIAMLGLGAAAAWLALKQQPETPVQTLHVSASVPREPGFTAMVGIAPDSSFLVFTANPALSPESDKLPGILMVRRLDRDETKAIDGTEGARTACMSADGRWLAFSCAKDRVGTKICLKKIALDDGRPSGSPVTLCDLPPGWPSLCWASEREIVASMWTPDPTILAIPVDGGEPRVVFQAAGKQSVEGWGGLSAMPGGQAILATHFSLVAQTVKEEAVVIDLATGKQTVVLPNSAAGVCLREGFLLAIRGRDTLVATRFDFAANQVVGAPVTIMNGVPKAMIAASQNGTLAFEALPGGSTNRRLAWIDERGQPQVIPGVARAYENFSVSPDCTRVSAIVSERGETEIPSELWILDLERRTVNRLPTLGAPFAGGVWSNDGQRIAFGSITGEESAIWERRIDGSGEPVKLYTETRPRTWVFAQAWSPDGKVLAFSSANLGGDTDDVWMLDCTGDAKDWSAKPYLDSKDREGSLRFSPDGKRVMFVSTSSGRPELYVQSFTGAASGAEDSKSGRVPISTEGGGWVSWWSKDGKEIRYVDAADQVMSVTVQTEPAFSASLPKVLYSLKNLKSFTIGFAPDGRLMAVLQGEGEQVTHINLILNFAAELRAKLAAAK